MTPLGTAFLAGLCLLASCIQAQPLRCPALDNSPRGQYCVSFKIVAGKLTVDRDAFRIAPSLAKFEPAIRQIVRQAIAKIADPLTPSLRGSSSWHDFVNAFQAWAAENPERLDLGTLFSADYLFASILTQTPDSGLVLNEDQIDPLRGTISFSILPPFDTNSIELELPAMTESQRRARIPQLRKRLAQLDGHLWSSPNIRKVLAPLYENLGLTPQLLVLARSQTIQITEGPRIASIILPSDQVPDRDVDRVLWDLLDTGHFRMAMRNKNTWAANRIVDFNRDLGYLEGDEPYAIHYQLQELQVLISSLGYSLAAQPSTRSGSSPYVDLLIKGTKKKRSLSAGFTYKPGQGFSVLANLHTSFLTFAAGGPSGILGSASYSSDFLDFDQLQERVSAGVNAFTSIERNRFLNGVEVDEQSTGGLATLQWQPWRGLDRNSITFHLDPSYATVLNQTLMTIDAGAQFVRKDLASEYPWRLLIEPSVLANARFADFIVTANTHRSFDHWDYDLSGRLENAVGDAPLFELPSLGGADSVRGFRADDAIGRRLWSVQSELWHGLPLINSLKAATFLDLGGAYQTVGSYPGLRAGPGTGLRLDLRLAVLKFDWAYGFGQAATGGSRGKFYLSLVLNTPQ